MVDPNLVSSTLFTLEHHVNGESGSMTLGNQIMQSSYSLSLVILIIHHHVVFDSSFLSITHSCAIDIFLRHFLYGDEFTLSSCRQSHSQSMRQFVIEILSVHDRII